MAVRQHLYGSATERWLERHLNPAPKAVRQKSGNSPKDADTHFPDAHAELTVSLLDAMHQAFGPPASNNS